MLIMEKQEQIHFKQQLKSEIIQELKGQILQEEELMTTHSASQYLKISTVTIWRLRKSGVLKYFKYGGRVLFKKHDLDEFISQNTIG